MPDDVVASSDSSGNQIDLVAFATGLIGLTFASAKELAVENGVTLRDTSATGWYTQEYQSRRIEVSLDGSGKITAAIPQ